jgi:diguanylate cyclase (GGDEF)-like protein
MPSADSESTSAPRNGDDRPRGILRLGGEADRLIGWLGRKIGACLPTFNAETLWPELAAVGCFLILPWIGIAVAIDAEYRHGKASAVQSTANLAQAPEESTRRTIGQIDYILLSAGALRAAQGDRFDFREWARTQIIPDKMTAQIAMADRQGQVTNSTMPLPPGVSIADRPHFRVQIDPTSDSLFISRPVIGRVSGEQTIQFSRKLLDSGGAFDGVIVLSLRSSGLARFYNSLDLDKGFVSILSADGIILARGPLIPTLIGGSIRGRAASSDVLARSTGSIELPPTAERGAQIASFRHLQDYPVIVMVSFDANTVFEPYRSLRNIALPSGVAITLAVGLIGLFWVRQKRRSLVSRRALTVTLDSISQGILMVDRHGGISVANSRVPDLLGRPEDGPDEALRCVASRANELVANPTTSGVGAPVGPSACDSRFETVLDNGTIIEVRTHLLPEGGLVQTFTDITEQREAHAQVFHLAHHDTLTGLANRAALRERISAIVGQDADPDEVTALVMIDLDGFKGVNDRLGHDAGDALLVEVGRRLKALVRGTDLVARLGGDEFVLLLAGLHQKGDILPLAERVLRRLAEPVRIKGQQIGIGASLGIAFHPQDGLDANTWFKHADMALYGAKNGGRGIYRCFDEQLSQAVTEHHLLQSDLRRALDGGELEVHFQPKFSCRSLEIAGFEALARWRHPTRGYVSPAAFIRIAEDSGLIGRLGRWILERACECVATWEPRYPVAVNVSVAQLHDDGLKDQIGAVLIQTGLRPEHLEIEVTESVMADDDQTVLENLRAIKAMGIQITQDDFGTGSSSLSYLRRFSFDKIKIDRSFVQGQADDPGVRTILEAILSLCQNLGLETIGEGVETQEQLDVLRDRGCTEVQGYLLGRPMPSEQVGDFIRSNVRPVGTPRAHHNGQERILMVS